MKIHRKKTIIKYLNILDQPIKFNPFVFSWSFLLWAVLGLIGGITAGVYWIILEFLMHKVAFFEGWQVIPVMAIGGLFAGLVIHFIGDPGEIQLIVNNIRFNKGKLNPKHNPSMILSSFFCIASGGSLGPEAPLVQVTGSIGTWLGKVFRLKGEALRSLSIAGMASGFTALFGAPLGGSLFALEILHYKHAVEYYRAIIPALVASSFSYIVFALIVHLGLGPTWNLSAYEYSGIFDFIYAVLFAIIATAIGWTFIYCVKFFKILFEKRPIPIYLKTLIGGLLLGVIAYYIPITRYFGHHEINELITKHFPLKLLIVILIFKIIAIAITVTSGWRGGFIIPLFFVGTTLGLIIHHFIPSVSLTLTIVSCMAAINACVTRTPMSTTILLTTLTGFGHLIPILFASLTGYFLAPKIPFISAQKHQD
ncbi:chloride channel protein [Formosa sediminum]|uniref:Chloride channel protein n=1 Tax=Formosa sediminum TaxID=2594004 RepID=A0A516GQR6_9FLAO|nr:chloride channel protein [Formosa sediminum]QDO93846.1 chloride channel protein [Formosa sediminum]